MYCGILLQGSEDVETAIAFLDEEVTTQSVAEDGEILALLEEHRPLVIALNAPHREPEREDRAADSEMLDAATARQFRSKEAELVEEGYAVLPRDMRDTNLLERAAYLSTMIQRSGIGADIIESNAHICMDKLGISGDEDLEGYGINTEDIRSAKEFEAVILALVAKLYDEDHYDDKDIIVPKEL